MANNVIRSFLVSLGWDIDQSGMQQFATSIAVQTEAVRVLGEGLEQAALKVIHFASGVADGMDKLYFSSLRTKATAENLDALKYAAEQTGGSAEALTAHVQNLNNLLNTRPGYQSWFRALGIDASDASDRVKVLRDFVERTKSMAKPQAYAYAARLGIGPQDLDEMQRPEFEKFFDESIEAKRKAGIDTQAMAKAGYDWNREVGRFNMQLELFKNGFGAVLLSKALPYFEKFVTTATNLVLKLIAWWQNLDGATKKTIEWVLALAAGLAGLVVGLTVLGTALGFIVAAFEPLLALLGLLVNPITLATAAVAALGVAFHDKIPWQTILNGFGSILDRAKELTSELLTRMAPALEKFGGLAGKLLGKATNGAVAYDPSNYNRVTGALGLGRPLAGARGIRNNNAGNIEDGAFARAHGSTGRESAGRFATFATAQAGLDADAALLLSYAKRGIDSVKGIIDRYAPAGKDNPDQASYIAFLAKRMGVEATAHLNLQDPKVLAGLEAGIVQFENGQNPYSPEMYDKAARGAIGGAAAAAPVTIEQHNTTTVTGAADPNGVAKAISQVMEQSNGMLVRSLQARMS